MTSHSQAVQIRTVLGVACLVAATASTGCVKPPKVRLTAIKVKAIDPIKMDLVCSFEVKNPNGFDARLHSFDGNLIAGQMKLAEWSVPQPVPVIPARCDQIVSVNVSVQLKQLVWALQEYRRKDGLPFVISAKPVFNIIGLSVPVSLREERKLPPLKELRRKLRKNLLGKDTGG